jgi:phosphoadenosine phosphosulfate reductase
MISSIQLDEWNHRFATATPEAVISWALQQGSALVTTNFRPYEAVILHMVSQQQANMPVLWVDHGANFPETYHFAEACRAQLKLNLKPYLPLMTCAHWLALNGEALPMPDEVDRVESFSRIMKLEPFERGMSELAPQVWITALRREQNLQRAASLELFMWDKKFQCLKVNPILNWTPAEMEPYLQEHDLPNERTYYDPAKGDEKHECGLHSKLTTDKV